MKEIDVTKPYKFFFETLGNKVRFDVISLLKKKTLRVSDIVEKLGYEQSLVSHHLKRLETCGFVQVKVNGTERKYSLNTETIEPLLSLVEKHVNKFCKNSCCSACKEDENKP